jgi:hypothetical protein
VSSSDVTESRHDTENAKHVKKGSGSCDVDDPRLATRLSVRRLQDSLEVHG